MKINLEGYDIAGTPAEMLELLDLLAEEVAAVEDPEPKPAPKKPAAKSGGRKLIGAKPLHSGKPDGAMRRLARSWACPA